jgi:uncharacterized Zn finger protein
MFDVETRRYRHRELFETPIDEQKYFPPDRRVELAEKILSEGGVQVIACDAEETKKTRKLKTPEGAVVREIVYRDWRVRGRVAGARETEVVINDNGSIIFGRCDCDFFAEHLMNQGPCEHMIALFQASENQRRDNPTSAPGTIDPEAVLLKPSRRQMEEDEEADDEEIEENMKEDDN